MLRGWKFISNPDLAALKNYQRQLYMERLNKPPDEKKVKQLERTVNKLIEKIERRRQRQLQGLPIDYENGNDSDKSAYR